ncbi:hypothetical protein [Streptomyces sp. NPDC052042]|uniref:hypothetical protein n=1 Tax=Streptomyces sp. NPDC052042 TaxID=3365683 RepID=UPI0037CDC738
MTYPETARAFTRAERNLPAPSPEHLPLSEWAETRRDTMTPATIAANHALHVQGCAEELRQALDEVDEWKQPRTPIYRAAREPLAAIGEGE